MKAKTQKFAKISVVGLLSLIFCVCIFGAVGCGSNKDQAAKDSIFYTKLATYVLEGDYTLSDADEKAGKGGKNEVKLEYATTLDLAGHTLDLNGRTLTIESSEEACLVAFKNGTIKGGNVNVSVPNGDVEFEGVTVSEDVNFEMEAASQTIRMNNSTLSGNCTIKSDTHVKIEKSEVFDVTLAGNGFLDVGKGAELTNLSISESAVGAKVNVAKEAKVKGDLTVNAAANVQIYGEVAKLDVKETLAQAAGKTLQVSVKEGAEVLKIDLKAPAEVEVQGNVNSVTVSNESANVSVANNATVSKVEMKASAKVQVEGSVANIVVAETAKGAKVEVTKTATVQNIVVGANDTQVIVESAESVESVKVVDTVTGANVSDTVTSETITKDEAEEFFAHTCVYRVVNTIEPTCTEAGELTYACIDCGDEFREYLPALGHDYSYEIITFPTETENGEGKYTCNRCGDSYLEVLPAGSGTTITVPGLGEMLQQAFGEGVFFNLDGTTFVQKVTENNYVNNTLESTKVVYEVYYLEQLNLKFDFSDIQNVKGSMNMVCKIAKLDNLESLDFAKVRELNFTAQDAVYFTLENDTLYGLNVSDTDGDSNVIINIEKAMEYLTNSNDVPQPVKMVASLLMQLTTLEEVQINTTEIQQQILAIAEALQNLGTVAPDTTMVNFILKNCFDKVTAENGVTTYTLNFAKVESTLNKYALMTLTQFADAVIGEGTSTSIKQTLTLVPDMTVNGAIEYISQLLAPYGITMEDVYALIETVAQISGGQPIDVEQMLATMGDMKLAGIIAMSQGITEAEAQQMVEQMVGQVIVMMDQMTVNDALTMLMQANPKPADPSTPSTGETAPTVPTEQKPLAEGAVEETPTEETPAQPTFLDMVSAMLAQYKDAVSLVITTDGSLMADVKVTVADQKFGFNVDMTEGLSFGAIYEQASAIVAQINASFNANNIQISGKAMGYYGSLYTDKQSGTFGLIVGMEVPSQNENGETVVTQTEMVNLVATAFNGQFTLKVGAMGIQNFIDLTATNANGNLTVMVPAGETAMPINLTWNIANSTLVAYVNLGDGAPVFQLTADWSVQNKATVALLVGGMNGEEFVAADTIFNLDFAPVLDETGLMTGFDVEYLFDGSMFGISMNGKKDYVKPSNGNYTTSDTEFCMIHGVAHLLCNTAVETEDTAIGDSSFLSKLTCSYTYWNNETYSIEYVEEGANAYYVLNQSEISGMEYAVKQMKVAADNGVMDVLQLSYSQECTNWYSVSLNAFGEVTTTYYNVAGEQRTETQNGGMYFNFYYNVETKKAQRDTPHTYDYTAELLPGSVTCEDGIQVMGVCTTCGKENNFTTQSHHQIQESIEIAGYPEHTITKSTCVCCGYTYISKEAGNHDMEHVNSVECDVDTIAALGVDTKGFYYGRLEERMCVTCNVKYYEYTWYTHDANGCKQNVMIKVGVIDHKTEEMTWITSVTYAFEGHHYTSTWSHWNLNGESDVTEATANSWFNNANATMQTPYTFSQLSYIHQEISSCPACGDMNVLRYEFSTVGNESYYGNIYYYYENGQLDRYNFHYDESFADYSEVLGEIPYDLSSLSGIAGRADIYHYEYGEDHLELYFEGDDTLSVNINNDGTSMNLNWYKHAECTQTYIHFYKENGMWTMTQNDTSERHDFVTTCLGENCVEDGTVSVCQVCGMTEGDTYYKHDGWWSTQTEVNGMYVHYGVYNCCKSLAFAEITLDKDVTLTQNIYICAETITLNLNGHNLDLNGFDFVLYSYNGYNGDRGITLIDDGMYDEATGTNVLGRIINTNTEGKGMIVLAANKGNIDLGNVNVEAKSFISDTDSRQTLCDSVLKNVGYTLVLGNRTLPEQKIEK